MIIKVTQKHIDNANKERAFSFIPIGYIDPIAQVLKKKYPKTFIGVGGLSIHFSDRYPIPLPKKALTFRMKWDRKEEVKPFEFEVK